MQDGSAPPESSATPTVVSSRNRAERRCYTSEELIRIRSTICPSPAYVEFLRTSLGPVASAEAHRRWTSRLEAEGSDVGVSVKGGHSNGASSTSDGQEGRFSRRPLASVSESASAPEGVKTAECSPRSSFERDVPRFNPPAPGNFVAKPLRASPNRRADFSNRLTITIDGNNITMPSFPTESANESVARSPREGAFHGALERRRMSPSPRASPKTSPRVSSSPPPGFGPLPSQRNSAGHAGRTHCNDKTRICKGPNLEENFASRIAYQQRKLSFVQTLPTLALSKANRGNALLGTVQTYPDELQKEAERTACAPQPSVRADHFLQEAEVAPPPTVNYNIASDDFDDLARRLAEASRGAGVLENKGTESSASDVRTTDPHEAILADAVYAERAPEQTVKAKRPVANQDEVDALAKWFARMSESSNEQEQKQEAENPKRNDEKHEIATAGAPSRIVQEGKDGLDSNVLSFFDSIRCEALAEGTQDDLGGKVSTETSVRNAEAQSPALGESTTQHQLTLQEDSDQTNTTEVERFFQLFTEGKPVYETTHQHAPNFAVQREPQNLSNGNHVQNESDRDGLERWFAQLASGHSS